MKRVQVIWSDEALIDLETIYDFIAENAQPSAQRMVERILSRSKQLELFPESGAKEKTIGSSKKDYRYLVEDNYKIVFSYQTESQTVHIAMIFDSRYDPQKFGV